MQRKKSCEQKKDDHLSKKRVFSFKCFCQDSSFLLEISQKCEEAYEQCEQRGEIEMKNKSGKYPLKWRRRKNKIETMKFQKKEWIRDPRKMEHSFGGLDWIKQKLKFKNSSWILFRSSLWLESYTLSSSNKKNRTSKSLF